MEIRKIDERISESKLGGLDLYALSIMCNGVSIERVEYLISLFNSDKKSLSDAEMCFLINYVVKGRVENLKDFDYGLYATDSGKKQILSREEVQTGDYTIVAPRKLVDMNLSTIIPELEELGFKFLETEESLLAFCAERNIVFWAPSIKDNRGYYEKGKFALFQQPRVTSSGERIISLYIDVNGCEEEKTDFPLFTDENVSYLRLYNRGKDNESAFNSSMKRIAQYPEIYHAVGSENQAIIDDIILNELYPKLDEIYYSSDASLNSKKLYMAQIVNERYGGGNKKAVELLSTKYDFQTRNVDVKARKG